MFGGIRVIQEPNALAASAERLFPPSRHRSARIRKKLIKRHGSEFRMVPTAYELSDGTLICHPDVYAIINRELDRRLAKTTQEVFFGSSVQAKADSTLTEASVRKWLATIENLEPMPNTFSWSIRQNPYDFNPIGL